jgi:glycosyltransferase involved in cell wall biosynthesis
MQSQFELWNGRRNRDLEADLRSLQICGFPIARLRSRRVASSRRKGLAMNERHPRVSLAIPVYNEEAVIPELLRRIAAVLDTLPGGPHEIVLADDGSSDRTLELLEKATQVDERLIVVALSRNFGHQTALTAALDHVTGEVAVLMDGDLQDPPEAIPTLLNAYRQGYDVVYVRRVNRKESWWLRFCYYLFYRLLAALSALQLPLDAGDFGLMSRRVVQEMRRMPEHHRYLRGLRTWVGFRQIGISVERSARHAGRPKYSPLKLLMLAFDGIFAFSIVPLRAATIFGIIAIVLSGLFSVYSVIVKFFLHSPPGFTATILVLTFLSGVNLFFLGVIGEYVGRVYEETKARPHYIIGKILGRGEPRGEDKANLHATDDCERSKLFAGETIP